MYYIILLFTSILRAAFCDFFLRFTEAEYNYRQKKNPVNRHYYLTLGAVRVLRNKFYVHPHSMLIIFEMILHQKPFRFISR